jgi:hypothetical protein
MDGSSNPVTPRESPEKKLEQPNGEVSQPAEKDFGIKNSSSPATTQGCPVLGHEQHNRASSQQEMGSNMDGLSSLAAIQGSPKKIFEQPSGETYGQDQENGLSLHNTTCPASPHGSPTQAHSNNHSGSSQQERNFDMDKSSSPGIPQGSPGQQLDQSLRESSHDSHEHAESTHQERNFYIEQSSIPGTPHNSPNQQLGQPLREQEMRASMDNLLTLPIRQRAPDHAFAQILIEFSQQSRVFNMEDSSTPSTLQGSPSQAQQEPLGLSYREANTDDHSRSDSPQRSLIMVHQYPKGRLVHPERGPSKFHKAPAPQQPGDQLVRNPAIITGEIWGQFLPYPIYTKGLPNECILSGNHNPNNLPSHNLAKPSGPCTICTQFCGDYNATHPEIIIFPSSTERDSGADHLRIIPLTKSSTLNLQAFHGGKHFFVYLPDDNKYVYQGRIPFICKRAKEERLYDLLADYVSGLFCCIWARSGLAWKREHDLMTPTDRVDEAGINESRQNLAERRGRYCLLRDALFPRDLTKDLQRWYNDGWKKRSAKSSYYDYFPWMQEENVWEMFNLLMDAEMGEIKERWNPLFAAHVVGTDGIADILNNVDYEEKWEQMNHGECAWRWFYEWKLVDLVVGYDVGCPLYQEIQYEHYEDDEDSDGDENDEGEYEVENEASDQVDPDETEEERSSTRSSASPKAKTHTSPQPIEKGKEVNESNPARRKQKAKKRTATSKKKAKGKSKEVVGTAATGQEQTKKRKAPPPSELAEPNHIMVTRKKLKQARFEL